MMGLTRAAAHRRLLLWLMIMMLLPAGCSWPASWRAIPAPPEPLPPGAIAGPDRDPLARLEQSLRVPLERIPGPALPGRQVVFYRYAQGDECGWGFAAYNPNRTAQTVSNSKGKCPAASAVQSAGGTSTGDFLLWWGFVQDPAIMRVQLQLTDGTTLEAGVANGVYFALRPTAAPGGTVPEVTALTGYDAHDKETFRWPGNK